MAFAGAISGSRSEMDGYARKQRSAVGCIPGGPESSKEYMLNV